MICLTACRRYIIHLLFLFFFFGYKRNVSMLFFPKLCILNFIFQLHIRLIAWQKVSNQCMSKLKCKPKKNMNFILFHLNFNAHFSALLNVTESRFSFTIASLFPLSVICLPGGATILTPTTCK